MGFVSKLCVNRNYQLVLHGVSLVQLCCIQNGSEFSEKKALSLFPNPQAG